MENWSLVNAFTEFSVLMIVFALLKTPWSFPVARETNFLTYVVYATDFVA